ncbi:hypothetical protein N9B94_04835 [Verrucomicrobia bacterium]|nr:hypothetical protein [Verrucomicrobiota bacterium]
MRNLLAIALLFGILLSSAHADIEGIFHFKDGTSVEGTARSPTGRGVIFKRKDNGRLTKRYVWTLFTGETLRVFSGDPTMATFVEVLIRPTEAEMKSGEFAPDIPERAPKPAISVGETEAPRLPPAEVGMIGGFFSGGGMLLLLIFAGASGWAGWVMGEYKRYPKPAFAGIGAALPFIGPIVMYFLPLRRIRISVPTPLNIEEEDEDEDEEEEEEEEIYVEPEPVAPSYPATEIFKRGDFNLNRRFVEHRFANFSKALEGDDVDMIMVIKSARGEFISNHITKLPEEGMVFQVQKGDGNAYVDQTIPYTDLLEIRVKHRDAPE